LSELRVSDGDGPFHLVSSILLGREITVIPSDALFLLRYALELQIDLLIDTVFSSRFVLDSAISLDLILPAWHAGVDLSHFILPLLDNFLAATDVIRTFPTALIESILNSAKTICPLSDFLSSLSPVPKRLKKFGPPEEFRDLNPNLCRQKSQTAKTDPGSLNVPFSGDPFVGIVAKFVRPSVIASTLAPGNSPERVLAGDGVATDEEDKPTLVFNFGEDCRVLITDYAIRSSSVPLSDWRLWGWNDGGKRILIDLVSGAESLREAGAVALFHVRLSPGEYFRYVSLEKKPREGEWTCVLGLTQIEFFGRVQNQAHST
jgi:hypothetical protein